MLPASMHLDVAAICLQQGAHFVSSSYVSEPMQELDQAARERGICLVNECGLDPGIDHLMAHVIIEEYRNSSLFDPANQHSFRSYCGGFPAIPNEFRYKFSWSPLGVLRALRSPAKWIENGSTQETDKPWKSLKNYQFQNSGHREWFQSYPNRDSIPFMHQYGIETNWNIKEFVRGTLRLDGWAEAWQEIFELVESVEDEGGQSALAEKSEQLWQDFQYDPGEPDRVVLCVELQVQDSTNTVWHQSYGLDASGNENGSAMARLVSLPVSLAVDDVIAGKFIPGVSAAFDRIDEIQRWFGELSSAGENLQLTSLI